VSRRGRSRDTTPYYIRHLDVSESFWDRCTR
jgi:hypothetical protein